MIRLTGLVDIPVITEEKGEKWIQKAIKKPGALRKALKTKVGKNIPAGKLEKATKKGGKMGQRARLAKTLKSLHEDVDSQIDSTSTERVDDHEGSMAKADLLAIHKQAGELYNMLGENEELEGWVQSKITKAADYINSVYNNMQYEKNKPKSVGNGMGTPADGETPINESEQLDEKAPEGWEATVKKMKRHHEIDNPWALAHWMKSKGYHSHARKKSKKRKK